MIIETYTCDKCKKTIKGSGEGIYEICHRSIAGNSFMGDNRIPRTVQFCRECFGKYLAPLFLELE